MSASDLRLRDATTADIPTLEFWDTQPQVIACSTDDPDATTAFDGIDWGEEIAMAADLGPEVWRVLIAEVAGPDRPWRPIGALQVIDPHREPTHYWGDIEPNLRAIDIWIGEPDMLGAGWGTVMMHSVIDEIAENSAVTAIVIDPLVSNVRAHRFYQRLGFQVVGPRHFDEDHCLVHRLELRD